MECLQAMAVILYPVLLLMAPVQGLLMPNELFPFGEEAGDEPVGATDDHSSPVLCFGQPVYFYGGRQRCLNVNTNGIILFNDETEMMVSREPFPMLEAPAIAPFYADVDTRGTGSLFYRSTSDAELLELASDYVKTGFVGFDDFRATELVIATWDRVGYYSMRTNKVNTFQTVLVSDTNLLFTIFLYKDIQWTTGDQSGGTDGLGGTQAQVGFNAGDMVNSFSLPYSHNDTVVDIELTSNIGVAGVWLFLVSPPTVASAGCAPGNSVLKASPDYANMLGGDVITIQGCFQGNQMSCDFDGTPQTATRISDYKIMCVAPPIRIEGRVTLRVTMDTVVIGEIPFTALNMVRAHRIDLAPESNTLAFTSAHTLSFHWTPEAIFPPALPTLYRVNIVLYELDTDSNEWIQRATLLSNTENDGAQEVTLGEPRLQGGPLAPVAVQVVVNQESIDSTNYPQLYSVALATIGQWTAEFYHIQSDLSSARQYQLCQEWAESQVESPVTSGLSCPPTRERALLSNSGLRERSNSSLFGNTLYHSQWLTYFHPGADSCFTERVFSQSNGSQQECCYDNRGWLLTNSPGAGFSHQISESFNQGSHFVLNESPYILCCTGETPACQKFYENRLSDNGDNYSPPNIGWVFGDPHFVTLDSVQYTFNGLGEYSLIETTDNSLTLQGRFQMFDPGTRATVLTAVVIRELSSSTVMISILQGALGVFVDGTLADFSVLNEQKFNQVNIMTNQESVIVVFDSGLYLEARLDAGYLSQLSVVLSSVYLSKTRGLLGVYNSNPADDLTPTQGGVAISPSTTNENIHNSFGRTWILANQSESLFQYLPYQSFSEFYDPLFVPIFTHAGSPSAELAEICNGNLLCLYDGIVSGNIAMATTTVVTSNEIAHVELISTNPTCSPGCANGVCVADNTCACSQDYTGPDCATPDYTSCLLNPCAHGERCGLLAGSHHCIDSCAGDDSHPICQLQGSGPCLENPCLNNGVCQLNDSLGFGFECLCQPFYGAVLCGRDDRPQPDPCDPNPCQNSGTCSVLGDSFQCTCADSYFGNECNLAMVPFLIIVIAGVLGSLVLLGIVLIFIVVCYYCCKRRTKQCDVMDGIPITNRPDSVLIKSRPISDTLSPSNATRPNSIEIPPPARRLSLSRENTSHTVLHTSPTHDSSTNSLNHHSRESFVKRDPLAHRNSLPLTGQGNNFNGRASFNHLPSGSSNSMYVANRQTGTQSQQGYHDYLQKPNGTQYYSMQSVGNTLSQQSHREFSRRSSNHRASTRDSINTQTTDV